MLGQICLHQRSGPSALVTTLLRFVWVLSVEYSAAYATAADRSEGMGADVLFPSFLYCVVYADTPNLLSVVEFMEKYSYFETPTIKMHAERGAYFFEMLKSAVAWVVGLDEPEARRSVMVD